MKKLLVLILVVAFSILLIACGEAEYDKYGAPSNGIFRAPDKFYLDWDIPSVRDISKEEEGHYSMPVYMFETYEELLHLKDIVGMDEIGSEINNTDYCNICYTSEPCLHDVYSEEFFEHYTLLIGWHQYAGVVIAEHDKDKVENVGEAEQDVENDTQGEVESEASEETSEEILEDTEDEVTDEPQSTPMSTAPIAKYQILPDGSLVVYLQGETAEPDAAQQWVLVAVPKNVMADCDSIAFFVKLPEE